MDSCPLILKGLFYSEENHRHKARLRQLPKVYVLEGRRRKLTYLSSGQILPQPHLLAVMDGHCSLFCLSSQQPSFCWGTTPSLPCGSAELPITMSSIIQTRRGDSFSPGHWYLRKETQSCPSHLSLHGQPLPEVARAQMRRVIRDKEEGRSEDIHPLGPGSRCGWSAHSMSQFCKSRKSTYYLSSSDLGFCSFQPNECWFIQFIHYL